LLPNNQCKSKIIHGIFKIGKQEAITSETDRLVIQDDEALICFCKSIHHSLFKEDINLGRAYMLEGIACLEKEKRETESPDVFPIQVDVIKYQDLPDSLVYNS
jgi:hypothetical protein